LASVFRFGTEAPLDPFLLAVPNPIPVLIAYAAGWPLALWSLGLYRTRARLTVRGELLDVIRATVIFGAATFSALFLFQLGDVSRGALLIVFPMLALTGLATRLGLRWFLSHIRERGYSTRFVLVVGTNGPAQAFADLVESTHTLGLRVIGHLDAGEESRTVTRPILGSIDDIESIVHGNVVDEVAICLPVSQWTRIDAIARLCEEEGKIVRIPMHVLEHTLSSGRVEEFEGLPIYSIMTGPDRVVGMVAKRAVDLAGAAVLVVLLAPLAAAIAVAVRRGTPGAVLFRQERVGLHGRRFNVLKFRTMIADAEGQLDELREHNEVRGHAFKMTDDPRVTRVGAWLRRTSLDELPQLWNVVRGDMSLVGPRPPLPTEVAGYDVWHRRRLSMKPGMTGLWQVRARREPDFDRWVQTDLEYIDGWSFLLDLKIMARTIPAVLGREGR
jgi:exopolysaccharide biosynthesis polyprenyl glycosylphosphotransferase